MGVNNCHFPFDQRKGPKNVQKDSKILDVGCNMGILVGGMINDDYTDVTGYDINRASILHGRQTYDNAKEHLHIKDFTGIID